MRCSLCGYPYAKENSAKTVFCPNCHLCKTRVGNVCRTVKHPDFYTLGHANLDSTSIALARDRGKKNNTLEAKVRAYPPVKGAECTSCGNPWFFKIMATLECTFCQNQRPAIE